MYKVKEEAMEKLINKYNELSERIRTITCDISINSLIRSMSETQSVGACEDKQTGELISLLCERSLVICEIIEYGNTEYYEHLMKNFEQIASVIQETINGYRLASDEAYHYAYDLLLPAIQKYKRYLDRVKNASVVNRVKLSCIPQREIKLFIDVCSYYSHIDISKARIYIDRLIELSRERTDRETHKEFIVYIISRMLETCPMLTNGVCENYLTLYQSSKDEVSGNFYWFYGHALSRVDRLQNAEAMFKRSARIRCQLYGVDNWYTQIAVAYSSAMSLRQNKEIDKSVRIICGFIDRIENNDFSQERNDYILSIEIQLLCTLLIGNTGIMELDDYQKYVEVYDKLCSIDNNPNEVLINRKLANNFWGIIYLKKGMLVKAEEAFRQALECDAPTETQNVISDFQIRTNLINVYSASLDLEPAGKLVAEIADILEYDEENGNLTEKERLRLNTLVLTIGISTFVKMDGDDLSDLSKTLDSICESIINEEDMECIREQVQFALRILQVFSREWDRSCFYEYNTRLYMEMLQKVIANSERYGIDDDILMLVYSMAGVLKWGMNDSEAEKYMKYSLQLSETYNLYSQDKLLISYKLMRYYDSVGKRNEALSFAYKVNTYIEAQCIEAIKYTDGGRLQNRIIYAQNCYAGVYSVLRKYVSIDKCYESLLKHKQMASLIEKTRNRILRTGINKHSSFQEIQELHDSVAEFEKLLQLGIDVNKEYDRQKKYLRRLENKFAEYFKDSVVFEKVTLQEVMDAMPDNTAIIEFDTFQMNDTGFSGMFSENAQLIGKDLDIYILVKVNNNCTLKRESLLKCNHVFETTNRLLISYQGNNCQEDDRKRMRRLLYEFLLKPIETHLLGIKTLYIAPCFELINLPFGILQNDREMYLDDIYNVVIMECARDFLFSSKRYNSFDNAFIISNPQFLVDEKKGEVLGDEYKNKQLPFSEEEARRISQIVNCQYISGIKATKKRFYDAKNYGYVHIATHGHYEIGNENESEYYIPDSIYTSELLLAGADDWSACEESNELFGNGRITADEVSRIDFSATELVVLSSCLNGMNDITIGKGFYGMIGAFSVAGVKYVIANLWNEDDLPGAILMVAFYHYLVKLHLAPPTALRLSKQYLRSVTKANLSQDGWLDSVRTISERYEGYKNVEIDFDNMNENIHPFSNEMFWGGLVCYQCNN